MEVYLKKKKKKFQRSPSSKFCSSGSNRAADFIFLQKILKNVATKFLKSSQWILVRHLKHQKDIEKGRN